MLKTKEKKTSLQKDTVQSKTFHAGIELELRIPSEGDGDHDSDACSESFRESLDSESIGSILRNHVGLDRNEAADIESYFDRDAWTNDQVNSHECGDEECSFINGESPDSVRDNIQDSLIGLTGNSSIKVVSDSSIEKDGNFVDAEVCWNYFASKETIADNAKIIKTLVGMGAKFNQSCGLHINLNNYLSVPDDITIPTASFDFLFDFVAGSRRKNTYCNRFGMAPEKYSMIYNQGDRLEFRFFSPTLEATKLNHYVTLANVVYKRLAGKNSKLPKKCEKYFLNKMTTVNGLSAERAQHAIDQVNTLMRASAYALVNTESFDIEQESAAA